MLLFQGAENHRRHVVRPVPGGLDVDKALPGCSCGLDVEKALPGCSCGLDVEKALPGCFCGNVLLCVSVVRVFCVVYFYLCIVVGVVCH